MSKSRAATETQGFYSLSESIEIKIGQLNGCCWKKKDPSTGTYEGIPHDNFEGTYVSCRDLGNGHWSLLLASGEETFNFTYRLSNAHGFSRYHQTMIQTRKGAIVHVWVTLGDRVKAINMVVTVDGVTIDQDR